MVPSTDRRATRPPGSTPKTRAQRTEAWIARRVGLTRTGVALCSVAVLFWLLGRFVAGTPAFLVAYGLAVVLIGSFLFSRRPLPLTGTRSDLRPRFSEGETATVRLFLRAERRLATFVLEERVPETLGAAAELPIATLERGESVDHGYELACGRRGVYQVGPLVARWGDPFGLTQREVVLAEPYEVLVHPSAELVAGRPLTRLFEDPPMRPPFSKPWPHGLEFYGMREYSPGDDIRRLVWRAYARTGRLLVREAEQGITDKVAVVLDQNSAAHTPGDISESFELGVKAAASVGAQFLKEGYAVTLEGNDATLIGPLRGGHARIRYLDELARVQRTRSRIAPVITRLLSAQGRDLHVVIITPHMDAAEVARLALLVQRGISILVAVLVFDDDAEDTVNSVAGVGCQVIELRPGASLSRAFRLEVGAGR